MDFGTAIKTCLNKYVTFSGRAPRSEFWFFLLFTWLGQIILSVVDGVVIGVGLLPGLFALAMLLPTISVIVRRLHDTNRSGWWYWIGLVPLVGIILLIVWWATEGTKGPNNFGHDPLREDEPEPYVGEVSSSSIPRVDRD